MCPLDNLIQKINDFRDERNWRQFHNAKDLSLSIAIEAAELLEVFQWRDATTAVHSDMEQIKDEIADVLIYCFMLTDSLSLDVAEIIREKLRKNAQKYPPAS